MTRKHPLARCEECPLASSKGFCGSDGPQDANIVFVGEAPGQNEAKEGKPFVGASGQLFNAVLKANELNRKDVLVTNVVACRPQGNADPPKEAIAACAPRMWAEIENADPEIVVAMGNTAATEVMGRKTRITKDRVGPPKRLENGLTVLPTIHPAAILRNADNFPNFLMDISKINHQVNEFTEPEYKVYEDVVDCEYAIDMLYGYDTLVMDLEVGADKDSDEGHPDKLLCAGFAPNENEVYVLGHRGLQDVRIQHKLAMLVEDRNIVCHNGKYDLQVLMKLGILDEPRLHADTMLMSYCLDERQGVHGLKYIGREVFGVEDWDKQFHEKHGDWTAIADGVFNDNDSVKSDLYYYNAIDCAITYKVYNLYDERIKNQGLDDLHEMLCEFSDMLCYVEQRGWNIDEIKLQKLQNELESQIANHEEFLQSWVVNPRSPKQVKEALQHYFKQVPSTDADHLRDYIKYGVRRIDNDPKLGKDPSKWYDVIAFCEAMLEHRKASKLLGTYVKGLRERIHNGNLTTTFMLHATTTGRSSSRNPNLQNIPRGSGIRDVFVPPQGYKIIHADYDGIELRVTATEANSESLRDILLAGRKVHAELAEVIYGKDYSKEDYVKTKSVVHGVNYARTPHGISEGLEIPLAEAQYIYETYASMAPELFEWHKYIEDLVFNKHEVLETKFGRRRRFMLITKDNRKEIYKEALAFIPQSTASDINLNAALRLHRAGLDVRHVIHDAIIVFAREDEVSDTISEMKPIMEQTALDLYTNYIPFPVEVETGDSWGELEEAPAIEL